MAHRGLHCPLWLDHAGAGKELVDGWAEVCYLSGLQGPVVQLCLSHALLQTCIVHVCTCTHMQIRDNKNTLTHTHIRIISVDLLRFFVGESIFFSSHRIKIIKRKCISKHADIVIAQGDPLTPLSTANKSKVGINSLSSLPFCVWYLKHPTLQSSTLIG